MKKFLLSLLFVLPLCNYAQEGMRGIGANFGSEIVDPFEYGSGDGSISSLGVKYMYNKTDNVRLVPYFYIARGEYYRLISGGYVAYDAEITKFGINAHYIFGSIKRFRPYAVGGLYYMNVTDSDYYQSNTHSLFGVSFGVGAEYRIAYRWLFQIETLMNIHADVDNTLLIMPSITYIF